MVSKKKYDVVTTFRNYDLHGAAAAGNIGLVMYALKNGQPINAVLGGLLPIHAAASGGSVDVVQYLIDEGADVNIPRLPSSTGPPIGVGGAGNMVGPAGIIGDAHHHHAQSGAGVEKLHKGRLGSSAGSSQPSTAASVRPDSARAGQPFPIGRRGSTPLHFAAAQGHLGVVRLLLENGANGNAVDCDKASPETVARAAGQRKVVELLREWQSVDNYGPRRSSETARGVASTSNAGLRPEGVSPDFKFGTTNGSTASLPLSATHPAAHSTSSLGRYPNPGRRPSLPSIYESPPSTSHPRATSRQRSTPPERPATASSAQGSASALPREPGPTRRPNTAGTRDPQAYSSTDDAPSKGSLTSVRSHAASGVQSAANKLNRIFKRTNMRPATASGALSTPGESLSPAPPTGTRSRSPSASKASDHRDRNGGFFHGHQHHHNPPHHSHRDNVHHHVSRDAISGPIMNGHSPYTSTPGMARPTPKEGRMASNPSGPIDMSTSPHDFGEEAILKTLNLTPAELQYAKSRGVMPDRLKSPARTAPASQTSFGNKPPGPGMKTYHSHSNLSTKTSPSPSPRMVPRHRANLGPSGGLAIAAIDAGTQEEGVSKSRLEVVSPVPSDRLSPIGHVPRPAASFSSLNRSTDGLRQLSRNASMSSLDTSLTSKSNTTGTNDSNDGMRSPDAGEESATDYISHPAKLLPVGSNASPFPSPHSASVAGGVSPVSTTNGYGYGTADQSPTSAVSSSFLSGKVISSRAQALELVEAQKRAIRDDIEQKMKARRLASATSHRTIDSPLAATAATIETPLATGGSTTMGTVDEDEDLSMGEEDITSLRERLAELGESVQMERRFARGEQQARRWNRESGLEEGGYDDNMEEIDRVGTAPMATSVLTRSEMLDGYLRKGETSETERVKRPPTPKRDVFGRPVTPKQREGRPPTPKENRPATPKNTPLPSTSRVHDAPRENRILPPPHKSRSNQHLGLEQTRGITKSDLGLSSYINKDDLQGRERAWTTTETRPRVGPSPIPPRPSTGTNNTSRNNNNGNLTIDIIQTAPTPTDAPTTPLNPSMASTSSGDPRESLRHRRRCSSTPLTIDAKVAQEKTKEDATEGGSSQTDKQRRQRSASRTRKPPTPTGSKGEQSTLLLHRVTTTPPSPLPLTSPATSNEAPFASFTSLSSGGHASTENIVPTTPVPALPSAVDLHNMHVMRAREEAMRGMEIPQARHSPQLDSPDSLGNRRNSPPAPPAERRLGLGTSNRAEFGYDSVRSFNEEKGEKQWRLLGVDGRGQESPSPAQQTKSPQKKFGGLFSRLKR